MQQQDEKGFARFPLRRMAGLLLCILMLTGCGDSGSEAVIPVEEFRPLLREILIAESGVEALPLTFSEKKEAREVRYRMVCKEKNISPEQFMSSFEYYRSHPEIMDSMYAQILDELNESLMEQRMPVGSPIDSAVRARP